MLSSDEKKIIRSRIIKTMGIIKETKNRIDNAIGAVTLLDADLQSIIVKVSAYSTKIENLLTSPDMEFNPFMHNIQNACFDYEESVELLDKEVRKLNVKLEHEQQYRIKLNGGGSHLITYTGELIKPLTINWNNDGEHWWVPVKGYWIDRIEE
jgi:hypothetical protein